MAVRRWASLIAVSLLLALPVCGQQQSQSEQQSQSAQEAQSGQKKKTSTQDLPSAPMPQPTAGQKSEDTQRPSAAPTRPTPPPSEPGPYGPTGPAAASEPPRAAPPPDAPGSSTSKDDKIDITPPANDAKEHPDAGFGSPDIGEFHPFDPHRAAKDVEVGDFYFKRHNYEAAISRYRSALLYKPNDAIATISLAEALEKAGNVHEAVKNYQAYLKILPNGPKAKDAHKALERLQSKAPAANKPANTAATSKPK
jgi:tetratricopeptide (TPR) repeat protein